MSSVFQKKKSSQRSRRAKSETTSTVDSGHVKQLLKFIIDINFVALNSFKANSFCNFQNLFTNWNFISN